MAFHCLRVSPLRRTACQTACSPKPWWWRALADQMVSTGLFPALGLQMVKVGEETGQLDEMLLRVADIYDREVATAVQRMLTLLEPVLIVGLGLVIAGIIMSILLAILSVNELPL